MEKRLIQSLMDAKILKFMSSKRALLAVNCVMLAVGIAGGPLVMRLYYLHGGRKIWLSAGLETAGWPFMIVPLAVSYIQRRRTAEVPGQATVVFIKPPLIVAAALIGLLAGAADYLYAYGVKHVPVSTSSLILATQLAFTAAFAFLFVRQRFTAYSVNAVALLTIGAAVLALHGSSDRPEGESNKDYYSGFFMTLASAAMFAAMLPLVELTYKKAKQAITYPLVMEIQLVLSLSATCLCTVGMLINKDFQGIQREAREYELGVVMYCVVLVWSAIVWQFFYLGAVGVIFYGSSLLSGIIISMALPVTEILAVIFYHEKFQPEKGVSLVLSLWGFVSYFYGEFKRVRRQNRARSSELPRSSLVSS